MQENRDTDAAATSATGANGGGLQGQCGSEREIAFARVRGCADSKRCAPETCG